MALVMYSLTNTGMKLSHSTDSHTPEMRVIHYLARQHVASREAIYERTGADSGVLAKLAMRGLITKET